ncbi:MAG: OmpA family protein [Alphaproteobacteria bacterium]|nr:OmpA family protein [Alphaproteobacteria bacterium]
MRPTPRLLVAFGALLASPSAFAQDVDTFSFAGASFDHQGSLQLAHPKLGSPGSWYGGLGLVYADDPLVLRYNDGSEESIVKSQLSFRLHGGYTLQDKLRLDVELPLYPAVRLGNEDYTRAGALGPIKIGALVPVLKYEETGIGVGLTPWIAIPTGQSAKDAYVSGGFNAGLNVSAGGETDFGLDWRANLGLTAGPKSTVDNANEAIEDLDLGTRLNFGVGANYDISEELLVGAELTTLTDFAGGLGPWNASPYEGHLYTTYGGEEGVQATLGLGTGLRAGAGAPDFRLVLAAGWRMPGGPADTDGDGLTDDVDACIDSPEDIDQFEDGDGCPELDNDSDGILDTADSCPNDPEDLDKFEDENGCPDPDNDNDGILDGPDACPNKPGPKETQGCPDNDSDGLANKDDACPDEPGPANTQGCPDRDSDRVPDNRDECPDEPIDPRADPKRSNGCPTRVVVTTEKIEILEKVYFDVNKATIKPVSFGILDDVAKVLVDNPDITKVEVAGHTDSDGSETANQRLSQSRVESVVKYLASKGVDESRLVAKGYGESQPIAPNDTKDNKAKNRRVEFVILEQDTGDGVKVVPAE